MRLKNFLKAVLKIYEECAEFKFTTPYHFPPQDGVCNPVLQVQSKLKQENEHVDWVTNPVQRRLFDNKKRS